MTNKTEQELRRELRDIIKTYLKSNLHDKGLLAFQHANEICDYLLPLYKEALPELAKEAGYWLPVGKAPLLAREQLAIIGENRHSRSEHSAVAASIAVATAQNDADNKFYTGG